MVKGLKVKDKPKQNKRDKKTQKEKLKLPAKTKDQLKQLRASLRKSLDSKPAKEKKLKAKNKTDKQKRLAESLKKSTLKKKQDIQLSPNRSSWKASLDSQLPLENKMYIPPHKEQRAINIENLEIVANVANLRELKQDRDITELKRGIAEQAVMKYIEDYAQKTIKQGHKLGFAKFEAWFRQYAKAKESSTTETMTGLFKGMFSVAFDVFFSIAPG